MKISGGDHADRLAPQERRRALRLGLVNAEIWSAAYAMTIVALVVYLAIDLGATGKALSFLLAAPSPPDREKSPYVAASDALGSVCHAAATIAGGFLFDWLADTRAMERWGGRRQSVRGDVCAGAGGAAVGRALGGGDRRTGGLELEQHLAQQTDCGQRAAAFSRGRVKGDSLDRISGTELGPSEKITRELEDLLSFSCMPTIFGKKIKTAAFLRRIIRCGEA